MANNHISAALSRESSGFIPKWSLEGDVEGDDQQQQQYQLQHPIPETVEDSDYFFLNQQGMTLGSLDDDLLPSTPHDGDNFYYGVPMDSTYETATRIFYATMQKFARPTNQWSFLESWHLHSMYSKSQQVLLGIPNAQSMVYLSDDDFMYTPQFVPQEPVIDQVEYAWEDSPHDELPEAMAEEETSYSDVLVMTAPHPIIDESLWMAPDRDVSGLSLDAVNYYRHGAQLTVGEDPFCSLPTEHTEEPSYSRDEETEYSNESRYPNEKKKEDEDDQDARAEQMVAGLQHEQQRQNDPRTLVQTTNPEMLQQNYEQYGTIKGQEDYRTISDDMAVRLLQFPALRSSEKLANHMLIAFELAEEFAETKRADAISIFFIYFVRIWQSLFLCAEIMLSTLGDRRHRHARNEAWV
ncbi:hypothetical protein BX666DRAFT_2025806 [Dichotomocladium elegans]|nr:hypothetical protein BX666DRAFT_2025806 [Dichotomocladium elegans]